MELNLSLSLLMDNKFRHLNSDKIQVKLRLEEK